MGDTIDDRAGHFQKGAKAYQQGDHYESHEFWEDLWQDEADDDRHRCLQGLIQVASAVHKARNDVGPRGCVRLVDRALEHFDGLPDGFLGVELSSLREGMLRLRAEVERQLANDGHCRIDDAFVPTLVLLARVANWDNQSAEPRVPPGARSAWFSRGLDAYNQGHHFDAHELWEEIWRDQPEGLDRQFLQGLIQVAAAMHKAIEQEKPAPAARLLSRALLRLEQMPPRHWGIDVARLVVAAQQMKIELARASRPAAERPPMPSPIPIVRLALADPDPAAM
jgi:predicted metal-dependent hydrolase